MNTVSKSWLRIRPASCMRLSGEYIAANRRAGLKSCSGSTTKLSAAAITTISPLAHRNRSRWLRAADEITFSENPFPLSPIML